MAELMDEALQAVQEFENSDDDDLFRELGLRVKAIERDPTVAEQHFAPPRSMLEPKGIALGDVLEIGRRYFSSISKTGYGLVCSGGMPQGTHFNSLMTTLGTNRMAITAGLATLLVTLDRHPGGDRRRRSGAGDRQGRAGVASGGLHRLGCEGRLRRRRDCVADSTSRSGVLSCEPVAGGTELRNT